MELVAASTGASLIGTSSAHAPGIVCSECPTIGPKVTELRDGYYRDRPRALIKCKTVQEGSTFSHTGILTPDGIDVQELQ